MMSVVRIKSGASRSRVGCRPYEDYECRIPYRVKSPPVQKAIKHVLHVLEEDFFEDALRLEEKVGIICPIKREAKLLGRWIPVPRTYWRYKKGIIILCETMDFDLACVVFAHECGHAVDRGEMKEEWEYSYLSDWFFSEAGANLYVRRWGFGEMLERVIEDHKAKTVTPDGLREINKKIPPPGEGIRASVARDLFGRAGCE